jgi:cell filamentation protein
MPDRYTYPDTEVLRNIPGLTDPAQAREFEMRAAAVRAGRLAVEPIDGRFDLAHLQAIHRYMYQDVWDWAGELRTVDTGTVGTNLAHARPAYIEEQGRHIFRRLAADDQLRDMNAKRFADRLAYHWGEITALHPFRDGNTRAQRLFIGQLTQQAGHQLSWTALNQRLPDLTQARLIAHAGDHHQLADLLHEHLDHSGTPASRRGQSAGVAIPLNQQLDWLHAETTHDPEHHPERRQARRGPHQH